MLFWVSWILKSKLLSYQMFNNKSYLFANLTLLLVCAFWAWSCPVVILFNDFHKNNSIRHSKILPRATSEENMSYCETVSVCRQFAISCFQMVISSCPHSFAWFCNFYEDCSAKGANGFKLAIKKRLSCWKMRHDLFLQMSFLLRDHFTTGWRMHFHDHDWLNLGHSPSADPFDYSSVNSLTTKKEEQTCFKT